MIIANRLCDWFSHRTLAEKELNLTHIIALGCNIELPLGVLIKLLVTFYFRAILKIDFEDLSNRITTVISNPDIKMEMVR